MTANKGPRLAFALSFAVFFVSGGGLNGAFAQAGGGEPPIVVEGKRLTPQEIRQRTHEVVDRLTVLPELGQYARWNTPVCTRVSGVALVYGDMVADAIGRASRVADVPVGGAGCKPNLIVAFSADALAAAKRLVRDGPANALRSSREPHRRAFVTGEAPVRWLYVLDTTDSYGKPVGPGILVPNCQAVNEDAGGFCTGRYTSSLIDSNLIVGIRSAIIIVDLKRAEGWPLESVAAYVARVALAQTPLPPPQVAAPTILNLFERGPEAKTAAAGLTQWDAAYLKALYSAPPNRERFTQRARIQSRMTAILLKDDGETVAP